jgi:hypothetical protein
MKGITSNFDLIKLAKLYKIPLTAVIYKNDISKLTEYTIINNNTIN